MRLPQANREVYELPKDGVRVTYRTERGEERVHSVRVIDWEEPQNNDFFLAQQMWITGDPYTRRPDLLGIVILSGVFGAKNLQRWHSSTRYHLCYNTKRASAKVEKNTCCTRRKLRKTFGPIRRRLCWNNSGRRIMHRRGYSE